MSWTRLLPFLAMISACAGDKVEDTGSDAPPLGGDGDDGEGSCDGSDPVIVDAWCVNSGLQDHVDYGEDIATLEVWVSVQDEDGDLSRYSFSLAEDVEVDGVVDMSAGSFGSVSGALDLPQCSAFEATVGLTLFLQGGLEWGTLHEWGVVIGDAAGLESAQHIFSCYTPNSDGSDA
jgi:hypothetical protein